MGVAIDTESAFSWDTPELLFDAEGYDTPNTAGRRATRSMR